MSATKKDNRLKVAKKYKAVLWLIYRISNQLIRQDQLTKILVESKYCANSGSVSKILKELEDNKLIKKSRIKHQRNNNIQLCKPGICFITKKQSQQVVTLKHTTFKSDKKEKEIIGKNADKINLL